MYVVLMDDAIIVYLMKCLFLRHRIVIYLIITGVNEWEYRLRYPSQSEIVQIKLNFKKVN